MDQIDALLAHEARDGAGVGQHPAAGSWWRPETASPRRRPPSRRGASLPPGSASTSARPPARTTASAISTADSSAPPVSSCGMICSMVGRLAVPPSLLSGRGAAGFSRARLHQDGIGWTTATAIPGCRQRRRCAPHRLSAASPRPRAGKAGLVWLCGLKSDMTSTKAAAVAAWAREQGLGLPALRLFGPRAVGGPVRGRHARPLARGGARRVRAS